MSTDQFLTPDELAAQLKVSVRTLQGWRYKGGGPAFHRVSYHDIRYSAADVNRWLKQHRRAAS